ncbi:hypothetical protein WFO67_15200 [Yersinia enterocolitica]
MIGDEMNKKVSGEESRDWEKSRMEKELIRLKKEQAEKRAFIKNKLRWLEKEPRAAFFYFFYLAIHFQNIRYDSTETKTEHDENPLSAKALGTPSLNLAIDKYPVQQPEKRATIGGIPSTFDFDSHQKKDGSDVPETPKAMETTEKNSLMLLHSDTRENSGADLDELLKKFAISCLKNKPATGVYFPDVVSKFTGVENILEYITETFLKMPVNGLGGLIKKINKAWSSVYSDFPKAFSWMDIKKEDQCIWVWNTLKKKGVSPPVNPLNNYQRWYFICATFDLWNGWTNEQLEELKNKRKKANQHFFELRASPQTPQKHKKVLMTELEKAWIQQVRRIKSETTVDLATLPAKSKKKLAKLSGGYGISEMEMLITLIDNEYIAIIKGDRN